MAIHILSFLFLGDISTCYLVSRSLYSHAKTFSPSFVVEQYSEFDNSPYSAIWAEHPFIYARQKSDGPHSIVRFKLDEGTNTFTQILEVKRIRETQGPLLRYSGSRNCLVANEHPLFMSYLVFIDLSPNFSPSKYQITRRRLNGRRILSFSDLFQCSGDLTDSYYIWLTTTLEDCDDNEPLCMHLWKVDNNFHSMERLKSIPMHTYDLYHDLAVDSSIDYCNSRVSDLSLEFHESTNAIDHLQGPINLQLVGVKVYKYDSGTARLIDSFEIPKHSIERGSKHDVTSFVMLGNYLIIGLLDIGIDIYDLKVSRLFISIPFPSFRTVYKVSDKIMIVCDGFLSFVSLKVKSKYVLR